MPYQLTFLSYKYSFTSFPKFSHVTSDTDLNSDVEYLAIDVSQIPYSFSVKLVDKTYTFTVKYNDAGKFFTVDFASCRSELFPSSWLVMETAASIGTYSDAAVCTCFSIEGDAGEARADYLYRRYADVESGVYSFEV